jgi:uncharacterized protein (DUF736 family)
VSKYTSTINIRLNAVFPYLPDNPDMTLSPQVNVGDGAGPTSQSQVNIGAGPRPSSQDGVSHLQESVPLSVPQLNRLIEASFVRDETSASNADVTVIPSQFCSRKSGE